MKFVALVIFALAALLQVQDAASWSFLPIAEPVKTRYDDEADEIITTFVCQADTPLTKCQVMLHDPHTFVSPLDLSRGSSSGVPVRETIFHNVSATYNGTGLEHGQCGATFLGGDRSSWSMYGCRGADAAGEWRVMDLVATGPQYEHLPASINIEHVVLMPGDNVTVVLNVTAVLEYCNVNIAGTLDLWFGDDSGPREHISYYGAGLSRGDCGVTLHNVTEKDNGPLTIAGFKPDRSRQAVGRATLIVVSPPIETYFNVDKLKYSVGDELNATCSSLLSRPVANLTWTLDDRIIRQDGIDDEFQEDVWSWPWDKKNITQRMSLKLEEEHFGKKLECVVQHLALTYQLSNLSYLITKV